MIQSGVGIVEMFGLGSLHTPARVLGVLLLQTGEAEAAAEAADYDENPHGDDGDCPHLSHTTTTA